MAELLRFTIESALAENFGIQVSIGDKAYLPPQSTSNSFWISVYDRTDIAAGPVLSEVQTSNTEVPPNIKPFVTDQYMLCVATYVLSLNNVPQGEFFDFLIKEGSGRTLRTLEQLMIQIGCGQIFGCSYCLATVMGSEPHGFEAYKLQDAVVQGGGLTGVTGGGAILPLTLRPTDVDGKIFWTPGDVSE